MMTPFIVLVVVLALFFSGALAVDFVDGVKASGWISFSLLAFGLLGLYSLIVGK